MVLYVIDPVLGSQPCGEDFSSSYSFSCLFYFFFYFGSADSVLQSQDWMTLFSRCSVQLGENKWWKKGAGRNRNRGGYVL